MCVCVDHISGVSKINFDLTNIKTIATVTASPYFGFGFGLFFLYMCDDGLHYSMCTLRKIWLLFPATLSKFLVCVLRVCVNYMLYNISILMRQLALSFSSKILVGVN